MEAKKRQINEQVVNKHDFCFVFMRSVDVKLEKNPGLEGGKSAEKLYKKYSNQQLTFVIKFEIKKRNLQLSQK